MGGRSASQARLAEVVRSIGGRSPTAVLLEVVAELRLQLTAAIAVR